MSMVYIRREIAEQQRSKQRKNKASTWYPRLCPTCTMAKRSDLMLEIAPENNGGQHYALNVYLVYFGFSFQPIALP